MKSKCTAVLFSALVAFVVSASGAAAQQQPQQPQPQNQQEHRNLWIAKFTCEIKAASAVAATQQGDSSALKYSNLFDGVTTFETDAKQPAGSWSLTANEADFSSGSTATRALIGYGAGRAHIEMEYNLTNPAGQVVWTQKLKTKPSFWGASGSLGAVQNQGAAEDEQAQKLTEALAKYLGVIPPKKSN
jgi:hypothetical protein